MNGYEKFLNSNLIELSSYIAVSTGDGTIDNLLDRDSTSYWSTVGEDDDTTHATITVTFPSPVTIDRIILKGINWDTFTIQYDSGTDFTPVIDESGNTDVNKIYEVASVQVTTLEFDISVTMTADAEKVCSELIATTEILELSDASPNVPYSPHIADPAGSITDMIDGGAKLLYIKDKAEIDITWQYVKGADYTGLKALYALHSSFIYIPFPAASGWDGKAYDVVITNGWDETYNKAYASVGQTIKMLLRET